MDIETGFDLKGSQLGHFLKGKHFVNILVKSGLADSIEVLANLNFFGRDSVKFAIVQTHRNFIVHV